MGWGGVGWGFREAGGAKLLHSELVNSEPQKLSAELQAQELTCPLHPCILLLNYKPELNNNHSCIFFSEQALADFFTSGSSGTVKVKKYR